MVVLVCIQGHFFADQPLDVTQVGAFVVLVAKGNGNAFGSGPSCPPNPVNVSLWNVGDFEVDDVAEVIHVNASGSDVCGHQNAQIAPFESLHGFFSLRLRLVAMDGLAANALFAEVLHQFVCAVFGPGKDQCAAHVRRFEDVHQEVLFLALAHKEDLLFDRFCC